ncbi:cellulose biosynthesis protein BcsQ [Comamonas composti]|uniref:cellulose biosynthesis protein BcsQ n=1 Tax=Comamonas composti TaxID=408558 RepID=UPI00041D64F8|nr:cellulose biosynthesis protein BcsQ [Comamonas composti]
MNILTIASAKGGVGKTTLTENLAVALAPRLGRTVLAVDLDPQNSLGLHFGMDPMEWGGLSRASLSGQDWHELCFERQPGLYVLPFGVLSENDRERLEAEIAADPHWLQDHLRALKLPEDALVLLDTPPGPSVYGRQALSLTHWLVVVTLADAASYATAPLMQRLVHSYCLPRADFRGVFHVLNQVDLSRTLSADMLRVVQAEAGKSFAGAIHMDQAIPDALGLGMYVLNHAPHSLAAHDLGSCADFLSAQIRAASATPST